MKCLKFAEPLPKKVLNGEKTTTWRINDDEREIKRGDKLSLCYDNGKEFIRAVAVQVRETRFKDLTKEDCEGHEKFSSSEEMYNTYSSYYGFKVMPETNVKVIKFKPL